MISYRPAEPQDLHFIVDSWCASYRDAFTAGMIQVEDWYEVMVPQVTKAMRRPDVQTIVAFDSDATDRVADLCGFITFDVEERPPLVYYVFTKEAYRQGGNGRLQKGPGIARCLFNAAGINPLRPFYYVVSTPWVRKLERKIPMASWRPLYGRFPKHERVQGRMRR